MLRDRLQQFATSDDRNSELASVGKKIKVKLTARNELLKQIQSTFDPSTLVELRASYKDLVTDDEGLDQQYKELQKSHRGQIVPGRGSKDTLDDFYEGYSTDETRQSSQPHDHSRHQGPSLTHATSDEGLTTTEHRLFELLGQLTESGSIHNSYILQSPINTPSGTIPSLLTSLTHILYSYMTATKYPSLPRLPMPAAENIVIAYCNGGGDEREEIEAAIPGALESVEGARDMVRYWGVVGSLVEEDEDEGNSNEES